MLLFQKIYFLQFSYYFRKLDCQQELEDFTEESRQLETELEATIEQNEKSLKDLRSALNQQQVENDSIRVSFFILF